jgi:hypothetical protein
MDITAIALLRIETLEIADGGPARVEPLQDAVLLHTGMSFSEDPRVLSNHVRGLIAGAAGQHLDPRGVFFIPDVAAPKARTYDAVLAEVGEGGFWGPAIGDGLELPQALDAGMLGAMLGQIPSSMLDAVSEITRRDPGALQAASAQLSALIGQSGASGVGQLLNSAGIDLSGSALSELVAGMQQELAQDPTRLAGLAEQLLGGKAASSGDDDEDA